MTRRGWTVLALVLAAAPAAAQTPTSPRGLEDIDALVAAGRTEEARAALTAWWEGPRTRASRRDLQRGLWLRGRLTVDPDAAALDFHRLRIEYPGGPFTHLALLRLAQAAHARGDGDGARSLVRQLVRDHPGSQARRDAEAWLADAGPAVPPAPEPARDASRTAEPDPPPTGGARTPPGEAGPPTDTGPTPTEGAFAVQLGAFAEPARAWSLANRAVGAGLDARVVTVVGSQLVRVRVGRFDSLEAAAEVQGRIERAGFTAALVRDANREERVNQ